MAAAVQSMPGVPTRELPKYVQVEESKYDREFNQPLVARVLEVDSNLKQLTGLIWSHWICLNSMHQVASRS
jgi:hypothetical protein